VQKAKKRTKANHLNEIKDIKSRYNNYIYKRNTRKSEPLEVPKSLKKVVGVVG
jgi:hypothetical protein